jgi:hypothetical protein
MSLAMLSGDMRKASAGQNVAATGKKLRKKPQGAEIGRDDETNTG